MTQSDNIVEFLSYASPRIDYIEHCMEKQAISAATVIRAAEKARKLARAGSRQSKGKLTRLTGRDSRALRNADGSLAFMYKDPSRNGVYRVIGDSSEGFGQKFLLDPKTGKVTKTFDGYKNLHHSNLNGAAIPSPTSPYALGPVAPKSSTNALGPVAPKANNAAVNVAPKSNNVPGNVNTAAGTAPAAVTASTNWITRHPYMALGGGVAAGSAAGAGIGYGMGNSSGQQTGAATAQRYYELRDALDRQRLRQTNDSFLSRLGNLFGAGDLSNMIG